MMASASHEDCWALLPWVANGTLSGSARAEAEAHLRSCNACARELATQRRLCEALAQPERVTHAPAPSFRKLIERLDAQEAARSPSLYAHVRTSSWPTPRYAWAATFVLALGVLATAAVTYHWSQPRYATYTSTQHAAPAVLHIALARSLSSEQAEDLLGAAGARVVEGPGGTGILGVTPLSPGLQGAHPGDFAAQMRARAARLRADPRVRWVEPLNDEAGADTQTPRS
jgi:hypothetical protein